MNIKFGQKIPKGYAVSCVSWENDGDDYQENVIYAVNARHILGWRAVAECFVSDNTDPNGMGNEDYSGDAFFEYCVEHPEITAEFCAEVLGFIIPEGDYSEDEFDAHLEEFYQIQYKVMEKIQKLIGIPVSYDYDFMRVAETFKIFYIEEDIVIPNAPIPIETVNI
ncbi:hypothetical protein CkP1_0149 [Citrobacter phage CkP1]|nr:hypothetical protein CkP1_0149 [Citrobacter phage CkP1]